MDRVLMHFKISRLIWRERYVKKLTTDKEKDELSIVVGLIIYIIT